MKITIIGHGAWGRAVGHVAGRLKHEVEFLSHTDTAWPGSRPDYVLLALPVQHIRETSDASAPGGRSRC